MPVFSRLLLGPDTYLDLTVSCLSFAAGTLLTQMQMLCLAGREGWFIDLNAA